MENDDDPDNNDSNDNEEEGEIHIDETDTELYTTVTSTPEPPTRQEKPRTGRDQSPYPRPGRQKETTWETMTRAGRSLQRFLRKNDSKTIEPWEQPDWPTPDQAQHHAGPKLMDGRTQNETSSRGSTPTRRQLNRDGPTTRPLQPPPLDIDGRQRQPATETTHLIGNNTDLVTTVRDRPMTEAERDLDRLCSKRLFKEQYGEEKMNQFESWYIETRMKQGIYPHAGQDDVHRPTTSSSS